MKFGEFRDRLVAVNIRLAVAIAVALLVTACGFTDNEVKESQAISPPEQTYPDSETGVVDLLKMPVIIPEALPAISQNDHQEPVFETGTMSNLEAPVIIMPDEETSTENTALVQEEVVVEIPNILRGNSPSKDTRTNTRPPELHTSIPMISQPMPRIPQGMGSDPTPMPVEAETATETVSVWGFIQFSDRGEFTEDADVRFKHLIEHISGPDLETVRGPAVGAGEFFYLEFEHITTDDEDFTPINLAFGSGGVNTFIDLVDDDLDEPNEQFRVTVRNDHPRIRIASGRDSYVFTIYDNDDPPPFEPAPGSLTASGETLTMDTRMIVTETATQDTTGGTPEFETATQNTRTKQANEEEEE